MAAARKAPYRPKADKNTVTQVYSDGIVRIYNAKDEAPPGRKPMAALEFVATLCYAEKKLGIQRYYSARQNQIEVERVLRVPRIEGLHSQQVAITEDGSQYRIDLVQLAEGVMPPSWELTLAKVEQIFDGA
ncbi:MAG: hypothetical protein IJB67_01780 [Firmicutes bacterium]|nr:hypothetical protein [Bacillota bacterium]